MKATLFAALAVATMVLAAGTPMRAAENTSETDARLRQALERFPKADANDDGVLTQTEAQEFQEQRRAAQQRRAQRKTVPPTHAEISYGPHERNVLDLWLAPREEPTPLLVCIHGGGFKGGDKSKYHADGIVTVMRDAGISVAAINYRLTDGGKSPYPNPMHDGARALQFLRLHAQEYGINPTRIACTGGSAGACMSMWLAFHDDLADPDNEDPLRRQSTRVIAIAPNAGQPILHPHDFEKLFEAKPLREHPALRPLFGLPAGGDIDWTADLHELMQDASPITHLSPDDPPVYLTYGADKPVDESSDPGVWVHHPRLGMFLKKSMDQLGMECYLNYQGGDTPAAYRNSTEFLIDKLTTTP